MTSTFIRAFALMLALTGFSASSYNSATSDGSGARAMDDGGPTSGSPTPVCTWNDPNMCGLR